MMHYTESEIVTFVRQGACPQERMRIAAQMNCCSEKIIYDILQRYGVEVDAPKRTAGRRSSVSANQIQQMKALLESGKTMAYVSRVLGVPHGTLYYHANKLGIKTKKL